MKKVLIGSKNPVKISACKEAFLMFWPEEEFEFESHSVSSEVSDQPMSEQETIQGAINRAQNLLKITEECDFAVGMEGGLRSLAILGNTHWFDGAWIAVISKDGALGLGETISVHTTKKIMNHIHEGSEIGTALDALLGTSNIGHKEGHLGTMTGNHITRTKGYISGILAALGRWNVPELYEEEELHISI